MSTDFDSDSLNLGVQPVQYYVDNDGSLKFISEYISSSNFNGTIPIVDTVISASSIVPGMYISITGSAVASQYFPVVSIEKDDPELEVSPSTSIMVSYLNEENTKESLTFDQLDLVAIRYEDWEEKTLGTLGWAITSGGNAIFSNVAVRGDLEATTLDVGGDTGIVYDGTTVTIGASVVINAPITFNGVTEATLSASLAGYIPDGGAASDVNSNFTTINGGKIRTGIIESTGYNGTYTGTSFSTNGMAINLDSGTIISRKFRIDSSGNTVFSGSVVSGALSSPIGNIGGFNISGDSLTVGTSPNIVGVTSTTNSFFAGATSVAGAGARFSVTNAGSLTATNANISGIVTASGGVFGPASNPINLINQGTNSILDMGTIKMVANVTSGNRYGSLRFYETNGTTSVGELNTAITNKTWYTYVGSQNGLVMGTTSDFYYVPTSSPSRRGRYQGNGFEVVSQDGSNLFSVGGGSADVTIGTSTNSKATNIYGITTILGGNRLEVSNGNFRLINTSNSYIPFIVNNGSSAGGTTANVTSRAIYDYTTTSTANIFIDGSATLRRFQSSTEKIKKDIEPISASFSILEVEVVQFKYKEETLPEEDERFNKIVPGFIAEQVYQVLPIAVDLNEGEPENWNDRYLIPVMVKTIQDQQKTIEELTNKLYSIEQRLESAGI